MNRFYNLIRRGMSLSFHELEIAINISVKKFQFAPYFKRPSPLFSIKSKFGKLPNILINNVLFKTVSYHDLT